MFTIKPQVIVFSSSLFFPNRKLISWFHQRMAVAQWIVCLRKSAEYRKEKQSISPKGTVHLWKKQIKTFVQAHVQHIHNSLTILENKLDHQSVLLAVQRLLYTSPLSSSVKIRHHTNIQCLLLQIVIASNTKSNDMWFCLKRKILII